VLRGGSWNNNQNNARCRIRNRNNPHNSNNNIGFRLVSHDFQLHRPAMPRVEQRRGPRPKERRRDLSLAGT
jgi:hypothetical protein